MYTIYNRQVITVYIDFCLLHRSAKCPVREKYFDLPLEKEARDSHSMSVSKMITTDRTIFAVSLYIFDLICFSMMLGSSPHR